MDTVCGPMKWPMFATKRVAIVYSRLSILASLYRLFYCIVLINCLFFSYILSFVPFVPSNLHVKANIDPHTNEKGAVV